MKAGIKIILITVCLWGFISCFKEPPAQRILFDFESEAELDRFHWKCHTLFSLSSENVTHGEKSLRLELYPSSYPGLSPKLSVNDWRGYKAVFFDVYNPEDKSVSLAVRIDDKKEHPDYKDRYNKSFILKPGLNHMNIPLDSLITSGTQRILDVKNIYRFLIFMSHPPKKFVLYLDYIRLM